MSPTCIKTFRCLWNPHVIGYSKYYFGGISAFFVLLAAIFSYFGSAFQKDKDQKIKTWCKNKWKKLDNSAWPKLPEIIIRSLLNFRERFALFAQTDYRLLANNLYINIYCCPYSDFGVWIRISCFITVWKFSTGILVSNFNHSICRCVCDSLPDRRTG